MSNYRRAKVAGGSYFFTVNAHERQPLLTRPEVRESLRAAIQAVRAKHPFQIDAWVLLPDHLHCIWTLPEDDKDYSARWSMIKRLTTQNAGTVAMDEARRSERRATKRYGSLWQHRYWEHLIRDEDDYTRHFDYIHWNPVKHGHAKCAADWQWSTFHRCVQTGLYGADWCNTGEELDLE